MRFQTPAVRTYLIQSEGTSPNSPRPFALISLAVIGHTSCHLAGVEEARNILDLLDSSPQDASQLARTDRQDTPRRTDRHRQGEIESQLIC